MDIARFVPVNELLTTEWIMEVHSGEWHTMAMQVALCIQHRDVFYIT